MTTDYSFGFHGNQYPWQLLHRHTPTPSHMSQQQKPLRHSIDAILHKTTSSSGGDSPPPPAKQVHHASQQIPLPPIETLRRHDPRTTSVRPSIATSLLPVTEPLCGVTAVPRCLTRFDDGDVTDCDVDSRADPSSSRSSPGDTCSEDPDDDVVVVDEMDEDCVMETPDEGWQQDEKSTEDGSHHSDNQQWHHSPPPSSTISTSTTTTDYQTHPSAMSRQHNSGKQIAGGSGKTSTSPSRFVTSGATETVNKQRGGVADRDKVINKNTAMFNPATTTVKNCNTSVTSSAPTPTITPAMADLNAATDSGADSNHHMQDQVKSAFRPIVRPWLAGGSDSALTDGSGSEEVVEAKGVSSSRKSHVGRAAVDVASTAMPSFSTQPTTSISISTKSCLNSLDAISMLRNHSSAFREACTNNKINKNSNNSSNKTNSNNKNIINAINTTTIGNKPNFTTTSNITQHHHHALLNSSVSSSRRMETGSAAGGVVVGSGGGGGVGTHPQQPLASSLASWFSWLRSGRLQFNGAGVQPPPSHHFQNQHPHHHHPHQPPPPTAGIMACRGLGALTPRQSVPPAPHNHHHQQAPRYNCEACGKSYSTFGGLSKHRQFHCAAQVKKDFRCKYCDKSYSSLGALKMHIRTHTLPCKCSVCGKAFSRPWLLQGHLRTHTGEKPFSCHHCARAFADRSNLRAHLQTHSDVKKYSCRHCSKTFSRMSLLVKHRESSCVALHR